MRRVLKIGLVALLCLFIILIGGGLAFLESNSFDQWARVKIVSYLEGRFPMRASLDSVDVRLLRNEFELTNLKIYSLNDPSQPAIHIDQILLSFTITRFFGPAVSLDHLYLKAPRIRMIQEANGRLNLSNIFDPPSDKPKGKPFSITRLAIKRLDMVDGLILFFDDPIRVETSEGGMDVAWRFEEHPERRYNGTVDLSGLNINVADFQLNDASGKVAYQLYDNAVHIPSVDITSRHIDIDAKGEMSDLRGKVYRFDTRVTANVSGIEKPDLGQYFDQGRATATGVFAGKGGDFIWEGRVESDFLEFFDFPLRQFESMIVMNKDQVRVTRLRADLYTGLVSATGTLEFGESRPSQFQAEARGISLRPQLAQLDLEEIGIEGTGDFKGVVGWPGTEFKQISGQGIASCRGAFTGFSLDDHPPARLSPVSFSGDTPVAFGQQRVRFTNGNISLPASAIEYSGEISFEGVYDVQFEGQSQDAGELLQVAQLMGVTPDDIIERYEVDPRGAASFSARLFEEDQAPNVDAQLQARDVYAGNEQVGDIRAGIKVGRGRIELDNVRIEAPDFRASLTARLRTSEESSELNRVDLRLRDLPIERFLPFIRPGLPVSGIASGNVSFHEEARNRYQGGGEMRVRRAQAYGENLGLIRGEIQFQGNQVLLDGLEAVVAGGTISGQAALNLDNRSAKLNVRGASLELQSIEAVRSRAPVSGTVDFSVQGEGSLEHPDFEVHATAPTLTIKEYQLDKVQLSANVEGRQAAFRVQNLFQEKPFLVTGKVSVDQPYTIEADLDLDQVPLEPYIALLGRDLPRLTGFVNGTLNVHGPLARPEELTGQAELSLLQLEAGDFQVRNTQPLRPSYTAGVLHIPAVTFRGPDTDFTVEGDITLKDRQAMTIKADGSVNLALLGGFMPEGTAGGQVQLNTVVTGTLSTPRIVGTAVLRDGLVTHPSLPTGFFDAEGDFKFTANQVSIDRFSARTTYGVINTEGGVFLEGFRPTRWQVNIVGSGLRIEYPSNVISVVDVDLDALKNERSQLISGAVYIRSAEYNETVSIPAIILAVTGPEAERIQPAEEAAASERTQLNISVEAYQSIRVNNNLAQIVASGDFTIRGTLQNPVIVGSATIDEGRLTLENNEFEITRGTVTFNNPRRTHPNLNFEASTEKLEHIITIGVRGPVERLNMSVRSEPPLPTSTIVSLLALNQTQEESGFGGTTQRPAGSVASALLLKGFGETIETRASQLFGFEKFSIDPFFYAGSSDPGARVTLGKQLTRDLTITYQTVLGNPEQEQFVSVEYKLTDWLTAIGTREENGSLAIDFKFRTRF